MKKSIILGTTALISLAIASGMASAKALKPGLYSLGGIQDVCLQSDGTWHYTTYSGLPGGWEATGDRDVQTILYGGTFFSGAGEDSIVIKGSGVADWTEFANSGNTLYAFNDAFQVSKISTSCGADVHRGGHEKLPPMQSQKHD
jgi:hypothetical protein